MSLKAVFAGGLALLAAGATPHDIEPPALPPSPASYDAIYRNADENASAGHVAIHELGGDQLGVSTGKANCIIGMSGPHLVVNCT